MIPPSPMLFTVFGSTLYGELWLGLCQALAAPWLDPCWLARAAERAGERPGEPNLAFPAVPQSRTQPCPPGPGRAEPDAGQVIEVPAVRWRARRARSP